VKKVEDEPAQPGKPLTIRQLKFIEAMLTGVAIRTAAKAAGVTERSAHAWLLLPAVRAAIEQGKAALIASSRERIELLSLAAIDTLQELMNDAETPATVRAQCAKALAARVLDAVPAQATETPTAQGIDYSAWSAEDLGIIYPLILKYEQEKKQA